MSEESKIGLEPLNLEYHKWDYKNTPHIILISFIFICQYFNKRQDINTNIKEEDKKKADKLFWKYIILFNLAKSADWCLGPFVHDFFSTYHGMSVEFTAKMISISFATNLFIGPSLIGYLNDSNSKRVPLYLYCVILALSCLIRLVKGNIYCLIFSQILFGMASSILYSSFENWFSTQSNKLNSEAKEYVLLSAFEKSMVTDALCAVFVSFIAGALKNYFGIKAPYLLSAAISTFTLIVLYYTSDLEDIDEDIKSKGKANSTISKKDDT